MVLVPAGYYRARAQGAELGTTKGSADKPPTDFVAVPFVITEGDFAGQVLNWNGYFGERSTKRTFESLQYCGCTFPDNDPTNFTGIDTNEVSIEVEHQEYEKDGEKRVAARVAWVNSLSRGVNPDAKMDDAKKASFRQRMMGQVVALKQGAPKANGPTPPPAPAAQAAGAKIPF